MDGDVGGDLNLLSVADGHDLDVLAQSWIARAVALPVEVSFQGQRELLGRCVGPPAGYGDGVAGGRAVHLRQVVMAARMEPGREARAVGGCVLDPQPSAVVEGRQDRPQVVACGLFKQTTVVDPLAREASGDPAADYQGD